MSSVIIANYLGAKLELRILWWFFPQVAILSSREITVQIVTWASACSVGITSVAVLVALLRHRREQRLVDGWACGLIMAGLLLAFQFGRHLYDPPIIDGWIFAQTAAGLIAATVIFVGFRPGQTLSAESEDVARPRAGQRIPHTQATTTPRKQHHE